MRTKPFRRYAYPLGVMLITAVLGRRIAVHLEPEIGPAAHWIGLGLLICGMCLAIWLWWRARRG